MNPQKRGKKPPPTKPPGKVRRERESVDSDSSTSSTLPIPGRIRVDNVDSEIERLSSLNLREESSSTPSSPSVFFIEESDSDSEVDVKDVHMQLVFQDDKLLRQILQNLDHNSQLQSTLVCKQWDTIARPIILSKQLQLNQFKVQKMGHIGSKIQLGYIQTMSKRGKVHSNILYDCRIEEFLEEDEKFPNLLTKFGDQLKKLDLHWLSRRLGGGNEEIWLKGIRNLKNLEELVILDSWHHEGFSNFRSRFSLQIVKRLLLVAKRYPETGNKFVSSFTNEEHIKDIIAPTLLSLCRNVEYLNIQGPSYPIINYIRENALDKLKKLHLLPARGGLFLDDDDLHSMYLFPKDYALSELTLSLFLVGGGEDENDTLSKSFFGTISALRLSIILKKYAKTLNYLHLNEIPIRERLLGEEDDPVGIVKFPKMRNLTTLKLTYRNEAPFHKCWMDKQGNVREQKKAKRRFDNFRPMIEFVFETKGTLGLKGERLKVDFGLQFPSLNVLILQEALCQNQCDSLMEKVIGPAFKKAFMPCVGMPRVVCKGGRGSGSYAYGTLYDPCDCCGGVTAQTTGKCVVM